MTCHCLDLGSASDWFKICFIQLEALHRSEYGISALVSETSLSGETSGVAKYWLYLICVILRFSFAEGKYLIITFNVQLG